MTQPPASVIIVSRGRSDSLRRVISAMRFQRYPHFELIVVTETSPLVFMPKGMSPDHVKHIYFNQANISAARNLGLAAAAGEIVAFCDDDAIPEPAWLARLVDTFGDPDVGIAGGFVRGRNGISFQWKAMQTNTLGDDARLAVPEDRVSIHTAGPDGFAKVQGTNCAFRRAAVAAVGGFDPQIKFFMDETDLCKRLGDQGWKTAIVPRAEVQHGFEASSRRSSNRAPKTLYDEGFSKALFLAKHAPTADPETVFSKFHTMQKKRLIGYMTIGWLAPMDIPMLLGELRSGFDAGLNAVTIPSAPLGRPTIQFLKFPFQSANKGQGILCSPMGFAKCAKNAEKVAETGAEVTVFCLSLSALFHRRSFDERGFWVQKGGVWGKSDRNDAIFRLYSRVRRAKREMKKLVILRHF